MRVFSLFAYAVLFSILEGEKLTSLAETRTCGVVYGELIYATEPVRTPRDCFHGLNASNCTVTQNFEQDDGGSFCPTICSRKATIDALSGQKMRKKKSVRCGAVSTANIDSEENFVMTKGRAFPSNLYGYEFRFLSKRFELDDAVVSCALKRSACTYAGNILIGCTAALDDTYLAGYLVHVELKRIFRNRNKYPAIDDNFVDDGEYPKTWWAVKSCHAEAIEVNHPPDTIEERVRFYWTPENYVFSPYQLTAFITLPILFFFCLYVRYIATECVICAKKQAFLSKDEVCLVCRCYGAELPPPAVLDRLKAEKAAKHNHSLNRDAVKDSKITVLKLFGIYQLPPLSCLTCCYLLGDCCKEVCFQLKRICWSVISVLTCGKIQRHRRPKIHSIDAENREDGAMVVHNGSKSKPDDRLSVVAL